MYQGIGRGAVQSVVLAATTTAGGAVVLPHTTANPLGTFLAYAAISIGVVILVSQLIVRIMRHIHR